MAAARKSDYDTAMLKRIWLLIVGLSLLLNFSTALAADSSQVYYLGKVVTASRDNLTIQLINGPSKGSQVQAQTTSLNSYSDITLPAYRAGNTVVVAVSQIPGSSKTYSVIDHYRFPAIGFLLVAVIILAILLATWRGIGSVIGLGISLVIIGGFVVPQILHGHDPVTVALIGSLGIATFGIFFAHGFSRRTLLALISTYLTLVIATVLSIAAVHATHLNGIATEDVAYLHQQLPNLNISGLLLGGIMIGVLGVLDDITVGQAAAVDELHKANAKLGWRELYRRALGVGKEHIASLINTLILAYAGSSFIFIVYITAVQGLPLWLTLNSELVAEEIVRSLVGSFALILAVPLATVLAAYFVPRPSLRSK